jgi:hypothetical protein
MPSYKLYSDRCKCSSSGQDVLLAKLQPWPIRFTLNFCSIHFNIIKPAISCVRFEVFQVGDYEEWRLLGCYALWFL